MTDSNKFRTILVVEDERMIRESLKEVLELEGYNVLTAENGRDGLDQLKVLDQADKPCLILLDLMMPVMGGREFLDAAIKDVTIAPIPIVVVSAVADERNTVGSKGFVKKPVDLNVLLSLIEQYATRDN